MAASMIKLHSLVRDELRPSPPYPHFIFTQHDLARVVQGMSMFTAKSRGRPRPRVRRRADGSGERMPAGKEIETVGASKSLPYLHPRNKKSKQGSKR